MLSVFHVSVSVSAKCFCKDFIALKFLCKTDLKKQYLRTLFFLESFDLPEMVCLLRLNIANLNMDYLPLTILGETLGHWVPYYESQHTNKNTKKIFYCIAAFGL